MKKISIILSCNGIGDILSSIPSIRYLHKTYGYNIPVFTHNVDIFKNFPYIDVYPFDEHVNYQDEFEIISTFQIQKNVHTRVDIRQLHAKELKIELLPSELHLEYYPDEYVDIPELPENYIVIHPSKTWPSRTWNPDRWQKLIDKLNEVGIKVVVIGKDSSEKGTYNTEKPVFHMKNVVNLVNKLNLDQTWHVLDKANLVITMDSGILHLAGTTDTYLIQLGSSINPKFRTPYRKGKQDYKTSYIIGNCELFCASDSKYSIKHNGRYDIIPPVPFCLERTESIGDQNNLDENIYQCHPSVDKVFYEVIGIYNHYNIKK